jgi:MoaA/NifB/PqqE/SkfB family radical SAM enzyme
VAKRSDTGGCLGVGFGGGEPTLHPDFVTLCKFVAQDTGLAATFTTHAHRIDDRLAADLHGNVHFVRVSMDGVGSTYERLRGRSFIELRRRLELIRGMSPFGINFVVNGQTFPDLDAAVCIAAESGATEFLLLPERVSRGGPGIDTDTVVKLHAWVKSNRRAIRLSVSEFDSVDLPICDPLPREQDFRSYAHIDASGTVRRSSFHGDGARIANDGVIAAIAKLSEP